MFEKLRNWLIRKLGGVPRDTYENVVEIANRHQHEVEGLKLNQQQMHIIPLYVRIEKNAILGRYQMTPENVQRTITDKIAEYLTACSFITITEDERGIFGKLEIVDRRQPYGGNHS